MLLISQTSLRLKDSRLYEYTKPWNANRIGFGQWRWRCHLNNYSNHITALIVLKIISDINSDIIGAHVQSHIFKTAWWIHGVSLHTAQGTRKHKIKNKPVNTAVKFLDVAANSTVPILSGTHSSSECWNTELH